ncbi:hypothetical protein K1T71_003304 [Dendrolimus kikuchii]|uniref:Uncharacterized protein n=1 Tax=Dendrolimus kikuchii TaxID=765133 RepID=A0ACC1DB75_9NEOP|nr:hypothetical protein K1T71_003304 [Dendrolimus kikuchii]
MKEYQFVARIHSASTKDLLCLGAVVSETSVLANGICTQSGAIRVHLGSHKDFRCKKGFRIKVIEPLYHDGVISNRLVLLFSYENMAHCSKPIPIGRVLDWDTKIIIIRRPHRMAKTLSHQYVTLANQQYKYVGSSIKYLNKENMLCVKDLAMCPVQAGDLLVQRDHLFGIAAISLQRSGRNQLACFTDLDSLKRELKELDEDIDIGHAGNESRRPVKL